MAIEEDVALPRRRRRWPFYLVVGLLVLIVALWVGYWYAATRLAEIAINRMTSSPVAGLTVSCPDRALSGFPLRVDLRCQMVSVADANAGLGATLDGFWASAPLYRPGYVEATLDGSLKLNMPPRGLALTISWSDASATASAWLDGLTGGSAHFEDLGLENAGRADALPVTKVTAKTADARLDPIGGGSYRLATGSTKVNLSQSSGALFPEFDARANAVAENVGPLGTDPSAALLKWARGTPSVKIDDFRFASGNAILTASGQLSLSKEGKLNGSILFGYNSIDALKGLIEKIRPGSTSGQQAQLGLQAIGQLSRKIATPDGEMLQTSLTFTDGVMWLAIFPIPIDPIPPIKF